MARIRSIKPSIWSDQRFVDLSLQARLLYLGMISNADDDGRIIASGAALIGGVFPHDDFPARTVEKWRDEITDAGLIVTYTQGRGTYASLVGWAKHQIIRKRQRSTLPDPPKCGTECGTECSTSDAPSTAPGDTSEQNPVHHGSRARNGGGGGDVLRTGGGDGEGVPTTSGELALADDTPNVQPVVAAYVNGAREAGLPEPSGRLKGKVGRDASRLAAKERVPVPALVNAARSMGSRGWDDLDRELQRVAATGQAPNDQRMAGHLALINKLAAEENR